MIFHLPHLPYGHSDLEPFLSSEQVDTHYFGHHKAYIEKVNKAVNEIGLPEATLEYLIRNQDGKLYDNAAQAWNHSFFWLGLSPKPTTPTIGQPLLAAINKKFGGIDNLQERFIDSAVNLFGSGWTWLVRTADGELEI